jgi:Flp pilus assembly pilin Flp
MTDGIARGRFDAFAWISHWFHRVVIDESGQDSIEYALMAGLVAVLTIPALNAIQSTLKTVYQSWIDGLKRCSRMPAPGTGGGC